MDIVTYSEARNNLKVLFDRVVADRTPTVIYRQRGESVVVMAKDDFDRLNDTNYLAASPRNAKRLRDAMRRTDAGKGDERDLIVP